MDWRIQCKTHRHKVKDANGVTSKVKPRDTYNLVLRILPDTPVFRNQSDYSQFQSILTKDTSTKNGWVLLYHYNALSSLIIVERQNKQTKQKDEVLAQIYLLIISLLLTAACPALCHQHLPQKNLCKGGFSYAMSKQVQSMQHFSLHQRSSVVREHEPATQEHEL